MNQEIEAKPQKKFSYWAALSICVTVTCVVANLITIIFQFGGFTTWKTLSKPPSEAVHIVDADGQNVWVEASDGNLYTLTLVCIENGNCNQWIKVIDQTQVNPVQCHPTERGSSCTNLESSLFPHNPLIGQVTECIAADGCFPDPEYGTVTYFALMSDGTVKYWENGNGLLGFYFFFIVSTIVLPLLVAIIVSMVYLIKFVVRKMRKAG